MTDTHDMDEPQKHYIDQKRPNTKKYVLYDFVYMKLKDKDKNICR